MRQLTMRPSRASRSLMWTFAARSAVVFVLVGVVLHLLVQRLVEEQFHGQAEFHAEFVTEAVLHPQLRDAAVSDMSRGELEDLAATLRHYAVDQTVYHVVVWEPSGRVLVADDADYHGMVHGGYRHVLTEAQSTGTVSVDGPAPYLLGNPPVASSLRTFVPFEVDGRALVAEIHQDWSPTLAASRTFSRTLDGGLVAGVLLLWGLSLPIAWRAGRRLHERSRTDELTELHNRTALEERLAHALQRLQRSGSCVALLFLDLDGFKAINDTLGHAVGDRVLREVGERLQGCIRTADTLARFAGDEFVVILEDTDEVLAEQIARRLLAEVRRPLDDLGDLGLTASIGMAATPDPQADADVLLRHADAAMYQVKSEGGGGYRVFDDTLRDQVARHNQIERDLRGAGSRGELQLHFQPFVPLGGPTPDVVVAVEALLRWTHPQLGAVGPGEFIPLAERSGTIETIGDWVIAEACRHLSAWQSELDPDRRFVVYVNLSPIQLTDRLFDVLDQCLAESGADPRRLGFEITETAVLDSDNHDVIELLDRLRRRGCRVALDDFGTGYSSLSRLRTLPLDLLKVDGSFVPTHRTDEREQAILTAVSSLAHELDIQVLAEGIETAEQLDAVTHLGFDLAQGYHLARPAPAEAVRGWLTAGLLHPAPAVAAPTR